MWTKGKLVEQIADLANSADQQYFCKRYYAIYPIFSVGLCDLSAFS